MTERALVLDPEGPAREALASLITRAGYEVVCAVSDRDAVARVGSAAIGLVLADRAALGEVETFVRRLQSSASRPALIVLDAEPTVDAAVAAFRGGAADYLPKTSPPEALWSAAAAALARSAEERRRHELINAVGERLSQLQTLLTPRLPLAPSDDRVSPGAPAPSGSPSPFQLPSSPADAPLIVGDLCLSRDRRSATLAGRLLPVTPIEHRFLTCLAERAGRMVPYQAIARATHGCELGETEAMTLLKTHVRNLRRKLPPGYLVCERAAGYMLVAPTVNVAIAYRTS